MTRLVDFARALIFALTIAIYAPIGFFVWIPLLVRMCFVFAASILHAALTRSDVKHIRQSLELAVDFWFYGFRIAYQAIYGKSGTSGAGSVAEADLRAKLLLLGANLRLIEQRIRATVASGEGETLRAELLSKINRLITESGTSGAVADLRWARIGWVRVLGEILWALGVWAVLFLPIYLHAITNLIVSLNP